MTPQLQIITGDCLTELAKLPPESVQCCVTSPPYWGLRDYGVEGQLGLEKTPQEYVEKMVAVFREVRRVLRDDGTLWLNLGDSYVSNASNQVPQTKDHKGSRFAGPNRNLFRPGSGRADGIVDDRCQRNRNGISCSTLKPKDLCGIPWRVAFALQADGWWLRQDIIWHKPNPMPESVTDRCTKAHEYLFLLAKSQKYYYDAKAISEGVADSTRNYHRTREFAKRLERGYPGSPSRGGGNLCNGDTPNRRSVWTVTTQPYSDAHFATFPPDLIKPCILAGTKPGDTVLDPFGGSGTTGMVSLELGRNAILIELNPDYVKLAENRCFVTPGLALT